jgi:hypothetical protein
MGISGRMLAKIFFKLRFLILVEQVQRMIEEEICSHADALKYFEYIPMNFQDGIHREVIDFMN